MDALKCEIALFGWMILGAIHEVGGMFAPENKRKKFAIWQGIAAVLTLFSAVAWLLVIA